MSLTFAKYATPPGAFSASEFASMTFEWAADVVYPNIAALDSVVSWCYRANVPTSAVGTVITPRDYHSTFYRPLSDSP